MKELENQILIQNLQEIKHAVNVKAPDIPFFIQILLAY